MCRACRLPGYYPRSEVVDFFTWRSFVDFEEDPDRSASFFRLTHFPVSFAKGIELQRFYEDLRFEIQHGDIADEHLDEFFPGPSYFLPLATTRSQVLLSIDCRPDPLGGEIVLWDIQGPPVRCFASLADAIGTATYCLQTGLWVLNDRNNILRRPQPFPETEITNFVFRLDQ